VTVGPDLTHNGDFDAFVAKISESCPPHTVHGHISTSQPSHSGNVSHEHHGQHGHTVQPGCPPHAPGHSPGLTPDEGSVFNPQGIAAEVAGALNEDGTLNGSSPAVQAAPARRGPAKRGSVLQLFASAAGLSGDREPEVFIGGVRARVLFSGPAPGLDRAWQINVQIPEDAPVAPAVHVRVIFGIYEWPSIDIGVQ
jgi:hypothetical protein